MKKILSILVVSLGFAATALAQPTIYFNVPDDPPCTNQQFCVPITVKDFTDILSMEYTITWDPAVIRLERIQGLQLPELTLASFDRSDEANGNLTLTWEFNPCSPNAVGVTLPDFSSIFELCFTALGNYGEATELGITNTPLDIKVTRVNACPGNIGLFSEPGLISTCVRPMKLTASSTEGNQGDLVCVDFSVSGFDNMTSMQFSINWDSDILQFEEVIVLENLVNLSKSGFGTPEDPDIGPGNITVSWNFVDPSGNQGINLEDGTPIFQVCYRIKGDCETSSPIAFSDTPTPIEVTNTIAEGFEIQVQRKDGLVQVSECDPTGLKVIANCGPVVDLNDQICIRVTVGDNFQNVTEMKFLTEWNPNILRFREVSNVNGGLLGFNKNSSFNKDNVVNGILGLDWKSFGGIPQNLQPGAFLFEVCFDVVGLGGNSPLRFTGSPPVVRVDNRNIGLNPTNCEVQVNQPEGVTLTIDNAEAPPGETICLDVTASNFQDILSMQFSMAWDTNHIKLIEVQNIDLPEADLSNFGLTGINGGSLTFDWEPRQAYSVDDGDRVFTLCFETTGPKRCDTLLIVDLPLEAEVISTSSNGNNIGLTGQGGEICVLNPEGYTLAISKTKGFINDTICVPFKVADFDGIAATQFIVNWDPTALQFLKVDNLSALGLDPASNFDVTSAGVGVLEFVYDNASGATLTDSTVIFDLCFVLSGPPGECYEVRLNPEPTVTTLLGEGSVLQEPGEVCIQDQLVIENALITPVNCPGFSDGTIELTVSGGTAPIFYNWNSTPTQFSNRARNLPVGEVSVRIFDSSVPPLVLIDTFTVPLTTNLPLADAGRDTLIPCESFLLLDGKGSTGPNFSYKWTTIGGILPGNTESLRSVAEGPGLYILTVRNKETSCAISDTVKVSEPVPPLVSAGSDQTFVCGVDTLRLDGSGSTIGPNIRYKWTALNGGVLINGEDTLQSPRVVAPGTFILKVTAVPSNCSAVDTVIVNDERLFPTADGGGDVDLSCTADFVLLQGGGGFDGQPATFQWLDTLGMVLTNSSDFQATEPGVYIFKVTDIASGCTGRDTVNVNPGSDYPFVQTGEDRILTCQEDTLLLNAEVSNAPDFDFQWTAKNGGEFVPGTETSLSPQVTAPGVYEVLVTRTDNGCMVSDSVVVTEDRDFPVAEAGQGFELTCELNSFTLDGTGSSFGEEFNYRWTLDGALVALDTLQVEIFNPGTYSLEVINRLNGCSTVDSVEVTIDGEPPQILVEPTAQLTCTDNTLTITAELTPPTGNYTIQWEVASQSGNIVSGANSLSVEVDQPGTYRLMVVDNDNGCDASNEVIVETNKDAPVADAGPAKELTCRDTVVILDGSASSSGLRFLYRWNGLDGAGVPDPSNTMVSSVRAPGKYELVVTDTINGCSSRDTALITQNVDPPQIVVGQPSAMTCQQPTVTIDASATPGGNNITARWTDPSGQVVPGTSNPLVVQVSLPGDYLLMVTNNLTGCQASETVRVPDARELPTVDAGSDVILSCPGQPVTLDGTGSSTGSQFTYLWTAVSGGGSINNATTLTPTVTAVGTYQLQVSNATNGCNDTSLVNVTLDPALVDADAGDDLSTCDESAMLMANLPSGLTGQWTSNSGVTFDNAASPTTFVDGLQNGDNTLTWTLSRTGCPNYSSDEVIVRKEIAPQANNDLVTMPASDGKTTINMVANDLINTNGPWEVTILSSPSLGSVGEPVNGTVTYVPKPGIFGQDEFTYLICNLTCQGLCDSALVRVTIEKDADFVIPTPNAFTPNGDGLNDELVFDFLENAIDLYPDNELIIFNRWNNIVYQAKPYVNNWRGTTEDGKDLPSGTYYYILRLDIPNGLIIKGDITIVK